MTMSLDFTLTIEVETGGTPYTAVLFDQSSSAAFIPTWNRAGVCKALYESEHLSAAHIAPTLKKGIEHMQDNSSEYRKLLGEQFDERAGWQYYNACLDFLQDLLQACLKYPNAIIHTR
jgi:hypothetical protein